MKTLVAVLSFALLASTTAALAAAPLNPPRVYTGVYQPKGAPTKPSALRRCQVVLFIPDRV